MIKNNKGFEGVSNFVLSAIGNAFKELNTSNMATITAIGDDKTKIDVVIDSTKQELPDVPFFTLQGGGKFLQFPIAVGDKCLLIFAKSTVEDWLNGEKDFIFSDNFDINNAFAFVGINDDINTITLKDYTDMFVDKIKIRNQNEELITIHSEITQALSDTSQLLSESSNTLSTTNVVVTGGSSAGTYPISSQAFFISHKSSVDSLKSAIDDLKIRLDTFKV